MRRGYPFRVPSFSIPLSKTSLTDTLRLNQFQSDVYKLLNKGRDILLTAPTGSGKTLTLLLNTEFYTGLGRGRLLGFVALYPNNTLLKNQMCTVEEVIVEHFDASIVDSSNTCNRLLCRVKGRRVRCECVGGSGSFAGAVDECVEPLTIYEVNRERVGNAWPEVRYIGFLLLSGRYIRSSGGVPKREALYALAEKALKYARRGGLYLVVFATPDTYLLALTGAYRDFEGVGKTIHNILLALARGEPPERLEHILRRTGALPRSAVDEVVSVTQRVLDLPLFIDEFHLYGPYEVDALHALVKLYKGVFGHPLVFSSATPAEDILEELDIGQGYERIEAALVNGDKGFRVRGDTEFEVIPVETPRGGLLSYFKASEEVPTLASDILEQELDRIKQGRALVILERLWMVSTLARSLSNRGLEVECIASIVPKDACRHGAPIIVGSEATTQGVNLGRVVLGVMGGTSSEDVIQRIGRVGRRGVDSKVYLVLPAHVLEENTPRPTMDYYGLVDWINRAYPNYPRRRREVSSLIPQRYHKVRRELIYSLGVASLARVSGITGWLRRIPLSQSDALDMLESFIGPPSSLVKMLLFRRTGFTVRFLVKDTGDTGETSIGIISRNFEVMSIARDGTLIIALRPKRQTLTLRLSGDPAPFKNKFVEIQTFLSLTRGQVELGEGHTLQGDQVGDSLVYVLDAGDKLAEYLSYTGEGADILTISGRRYAVVFV